MDLILQDVIELEIFDENGKKITDMKNITKSSLSLKTEHGNQYQYLIINDAVCNLELLKLLNTNKEDNSLETDFDKSTNSTKQFSISIGGKEPVNLKIIGRGIFYDLNTANISHDFKVIAPKAQLITDELFINTKCGKPTQPSYIFKLLPYEENKNFDIVFTER